jgi:photosystem II stability/assembly factor-like uncharacterized protein
LLVAWWVFWTSPVWADDPPTPASVPKGEVLKFTFEYSEIFPGTVRDYWVDIPAQYDPAHPACVYVNQDGIQNNAHVVFDQIIASKEMPVTTGVFVAPGRVPAPHPDALDRFNRSVEYDTMSDAYASFLLQELLPDVQEKTASDGRAILLSENPEDRAIGGAGSGAICAFTAARERLITLLLTLVGVEETSAPDPSARWETLPAITTARLRGVAVAADGTLWASGGDGTVLTTRPDQDRPTLVPIPDSMGRDFRDIEAIGEDTLVLLAIGKGEKSRILKSTDRGSTWSTRFVMEDPEGFLDAIAFRDERHGLALGDPLEGRFTILTTDDGGDSWMRIPAEGMPESRVGEGAFAASGTCLVVAATANAWFCTGGADSARVFNSTDRGRTWTAHLTPIPAPNASSGLFSLAFRDPLHGIAVGGDYEAPDRGGAVTVVTDDGGVTWNRPSGRTPGGLRSAVVHIPGSFSKRWIAVGPNGSDLSLDDGATWAPIEGGGFHAVATRGENATWGVGESGRVGRLRIGDRAR